MLMSEWECGDHQSVQGYTALYRPLNETGASQFQPARATFFSPENPCCRLLTFLPPLVAMSSTKR